MPRLFHHHRRNPWLIVALLLALASLVGCSAPQESADTVDADDPAQGSTRPRRFSAEWLIDTTAIERDDEVASPFIYREVVDDQTGTYLVETADHLALQQPTDVVLCAAVSRVPIDPFCASKPRAEGAPHVLSFPIQILRNDWSPQALYDLAGYREVSLVAAADPDNWITQRTVATAGFPIECFLVTGDTSAAATGFEVCFTDDELHLVASVDLQNDLIFEIELLSYERVSIIEDFETGFEDFFEERPSLQEQLLDLYPEIPAARPTPTPDVG